MRKGVNPEKDKTEKNLVKFHRIIIPVYIPNLTEEYYTESLQVFESCIESLIKTINYKTTAITVVNNCSHTELTNRINNYLDKGQIEKHVQYHENRGKVYAVLSEAKASYEAFITIVDADVLFFSGWERSIFEVFKNFPKAGVVSPLPSQNLALYKNNSIFYDHFLQGRIKYGKIVNDKDCDLFLKGMGNSALLKRNKHKYSWKERQYYIKKKIPAVIGAGHFVATYRKEIFNNINSFPEWKFKNGFEEEFLDEPADQLGWYRLSTVGTYAYHIGNKMDKVVRNHKFEENKLLDLKTKFLI